MTNKVSRIFVMRHGERLDLNFDDWITTSFDSSGNYNPRDLNMPETLPSRANGPQGWIRDSPLTNVGVLQARLIGNALHRNGVKIDRAYSSPAYRSITTCASALHGLQQMDELPVNVEASLFEWVGWHKHLGLAAVDWLSVAELRAAGLNVSERYEPRIANKDMFARLEETADEFQDRTGGFVEQLAVGVKDGETILLVAHGPTGQVSQQRLLGKPKLTEDELNILMPKIPYCSLIELQKEGNEWKLIEASPYTVTHQANKTWNVGVLLNKGEYEEVVVV